MVYKLRICDLVSREVGWRLRYLISLAICFACASASVCPLISSMKRRI